MHTYRIVRQAWGLLALGILGFTSTAWAQVDIMPDREAFLGAPVVVWGNTTLAGGTPYTIDFGDGTPVVNGVVSASSQSYISTTHTYTTTDPAGYTATLTVGGSSASATIHVVDGAALTRSNWRTSRSTTRSRTVCATSITPSTAARRGTTPAGTWHRGLAMGHSHRWRRSRSRITATRSTAATFIHRWSRAA